MPRRMRTKATSESPTVIYKWGKAASFNKVPAQVVGEELERLEIKPGNFHRAKDVLEAARDARSPLHHAFIWDDEVAAELHRLNTCRHMLRSLCVEIIQGDKKERKPLLVHVTDEDGPRYVKADKVAGDSDLQRKAVAEVIALLQGIRRRFDFVKELRPVFDAIDEAADELAG